MRRLNDARGFTMAELLVAVAVGATVMGAALVLTTQVQRAFTSQLDGAGVQQEVRYAMDWISRALMQAGSNPTTMTVSACPAAGTAFRTVRRDPNADGVHNDVRLHADVSPPNGLLGGLAGACTEAGEDITIGYNAVDRTITRRDNNIDAAAVAMSGNVFSGLLFQYLDANGNAAATDDATATVRVTITGRTPAIDPHTGQPLTFTLVSNVRLRSR